MVEKLARCGIFCGQCSAFHGKVADLAKQLYHEIETDYSWAKESSEFNYNELLKGLAWMKEQRCPGCRQVSESWCDVKNCSKIQNNEIDNCLICEDFLSCSKTEYQRNRYSYLIKDYNSLKKISIKEYLKLQDEKEKKGIRIQDIRDY